INQKDSGGAGIHGQIATAENLQCASVEHWEEFTLSSEALTGGVNYILSIQGNEDDTSPPFEVYELRYDTDGSVDSYYEDSTGDYGVPESPWVEAASGTTRDYSIYCNYTEVAVGLENKSANMGSKMVAAGLI
ncbi:unnamed protein product, partial [marine sediment metagenome]